jgi:hypothetical protein
MKQEPLLRTFRPDRPGIRKILGDLEAEIMEYVWARPAEQGVTVREVFEAISTQRHIAYTTVMSTMSRLAKKQVLRVTTEQTAYRYTPTMGQEALPSPRCSCLSLAVFFWSISGQPSRKGTDGEGSTCSSWRCPS